MTDISYSVYDPNGNVTILVGTPVQPEKRAETATRLMEKEKRAEQTGFVSFDCADADIELNMAGGEFCANATLCAAAHYKKSHGDKKLVKVKVSGCEEIIPVEISKDGEVFTATEALPSPAGIEERDFVFGEETFRLPVVTLDGISHIIAPEDFGKEKASEAIAQWCEELNAPALGIMLLSEKPYRMTPVVYVPAAGTLFFENSCGSGTCAAGAYLARLYGGEITEEIAQPGGTLKVSTAPGGKIRLTGKVAELKQNGIF